MEFCRVDGTTALLLTTKGLTPAVATASGSLFLIGMVAGRVTAGRVVLRVGSSALFRGALGITGIGFALFWLSPGAPAPLAGVFITGLACRNAHHVRNASSRNDPGNPMSRTPLPGDPGAHRRFGGQRSAAGPGQWRARGLRGEGRSDHRGRSRFLRPRADLQRPGRAAQCPCLRARAPAIARVWLTRFSLCDAI